MLPIRQQILASLVARHGRRIRPEWAKHAGKINGVHVFGIGLGILIAVTCFALDINEGPKERDYIFGSGIGYPLRNMDSRKLTCH